MSKQKKIIECLILIGILSGQFAFLFKILRHERTISTSFYRTYILLHADYMLYSRNEDSVGNLICESFRSDGRDAVRELERKNIRIEIFRTCHTD